MINFRSVVWQNFLSTGNTPIEIVLDKSSSTLIIGENGSGKSTVLDALCFGLFGKPFRRIKKDQLVNSVNERDCKVEIYFDIGKRKYLIIRSIRPTRFEIYMDGKLLNQDASAKDYQKQLENNILKLNHKSFTQVVILGSSSFIPFMQLTASARREVVEDILDIKIFSMMNVMLPVASVATKSGITSPSGDTCELNCPTGLKSSPVAARYLANTSFAFRELRSRYSKASVAKFS